MEILVKTVLRCAKKGNLVERAIIESVQSERRHLRCLAAELAKASTCSWPLRLFLNKTPAEMKNPYFVGQGH